MAVKLSFVFSCFCLTLSVCGVIDPEYNDISTSWGHPRGLMSHCPGSSKPATIPRSQLKYLHFIVHGKGQRTKYTYWSAKKIAQDPKIDFRRKTMLLALGYLDSPHFPIATIFANEYEKRGYNVILVDNQRFSSVHYFLASRLMRPVGKHVAEVLAQLMEAGLNLTTLELVGFSLGGHTVSFIGSHFQEITGKNISRITGLEPAGPCFRFRGPKDRLDASNADFVEVLHTNIDGLGMEQRMGHVDFFFNGGEYQPSYVDMYPCTSTCSHFRVLWLWLAALKHPNKFIGMKCDNTEQARSLRCYDRVPLESNTVGLDVDRGKHGIFYISTRKGYPFYLGEEGLKEENVSWNRISDATCGNETEIYT